jgi:hypothetical protein
MLGACYLYFKRNAEKFGVCVIRKVRAIRRKKRQLQLFVCFLKFVHVVFIYLPLITIIYDRNLLSIGKNTSELGYNAMKGTAHFKSL